MKRVTISIAGGDSETVNMIETEANSGIFIIDNHNNILKTLFTNGPIKKDYGILEFTNNDLHKDIVVTYSDPHNHDGQQQLFTTKFKVHTTPGRINLPSSIRLDDKQIVLSINDSDLNVNPESKDSYTFTPINNKPLPLVTANMKLDSFAQIQIQIGGNIKNSAAGTTTTNTSTFYGNKTFMLVETGIDTGIFEAKMHIKDIADALGRSLKVGDNIIITYFDNMELPPHRSSKGIIVKG